MGYEKFDNRKMEVLAPAGSFDIMKAVISAGADAVYLGGNMFGARANAVNFSDEELIEAIDYAHLFDRRIYMTVNTLLKENEIEDYLVSYLKPFYEAGLDAVIVQDLGVMHVISEEFPKLHIHASTQMTQTGSIGAGILKKLGATRVVTSRELSLDDIRSIHKKCPDLEIESFVHGALCYCYSGQCLLSSFNGGRSGNRGRCAQPCRLAYDVTDANGKKMNQQNEKYVLSPKDMCALNILPDIYDAGVYSLKIEGRMKNITYASYVTSIYRKYTDMLLNEGREHYKVDVQDINNLMDIYNRGAFTDGYYNSNKGRNMISLGRPNHMGTKALSVLSNVNGRVEFKALEDINALDVFEIDSEHSFTSGENVKKGESLIVNLPKKYNLPKGRAIYRTRNNSLTKYVEENFADQHPKMPVDMQFYASVGEPMSLTLTYKDKSVYVEGNIVSQAASHPATVENVKKQLEKMGNTYFTADETDVFLNGDTFLPVGNIKELRREACEKLYKEIINEYKRLPQSGILERCAYFAEANKSKAEDNKNAAFKNYTCQDDNGQADICKKSVLLNDTDCLKTVLKDNSVEEIYLNSDLYFKDKEKFLSDINAVKNAGKGVYCALPFILKEDKKNKLLKFIEELNDIDNVGYLVRNIEEIGFIGEFSKNKHIITDAGIYIYNQYAVKQLASIIESSGVFCDRMTYPYELNNKELSKLSKIIDKNKTELVVYGNIPMMISEQCVRKTFGLCDGRFGNIDIANERIGKYRVVSSCAFCQSQMYDVNKYNITGCKETKGLSGYIRYEFDNETESEIIDILSDKVTKGDTGHFYGGVM